MSKTWGDYTRQCTSRVVSSLAPEVMSKTHDEREVVACLSSVVEHIANETNLPIVECQAHHLKDKGSAAA